MQIMMDHSEAEGSRVTPLTQYVLTEVIDTDEVIGHGSYAVVKKLKFRGLECVGKKMHDILYLNATPQQRKDMLSRFEGECELLSQLRHPCIVQFLGVFFEEGTPLPVLVMEYLHSTLAATIDRYGILPEQISYSILCEVSLGLRYLHEHSPPIVHRDLSANNVLLTPNMSAKISDLGVAKILNLTPAQMTQLVHTTAPGTPCYMPPEALSSRPRYNAKIDIYSIGVMMVHVFCGEWPFPLDVFQPDPQNPDSLVPLTEVQRRAEFLQRIGDNHCLVPLMHQCLSNNPILRPDAAQISTQLSQIKADLPAMAETRIEWCKQLQSAQDEIKALRKIVENTLREKKPKIPRRIRHSSLPQENSKAADSVTVAARSEELLHSESKLQWKSCADMPTRAYRLQAVAVGNLVYVGGGVPENHSERFSVFTYNPVTDQWLCLPDHCVAWFGLCEFHGEVVTIGGKSSKETNKVYRYDTSEKKWVEHLKPMPTARYGLSVISTSSVIVGCGGSTGIQDRKPTVTAAVEVYTSTTAQWHKADPLPEPGWLLSTTILNGKIFLVGGATDGPVAQVMMESMFYADLRMLVDRATSSTSQDSLSAGRTPWRLMHTPLLVSTASTLGGILVAVGGMNDSNKSQVAVYMCVPSNRLSPAYLWTRLLRGDLPFEQHRSTAVQLPNNQILVLGGKDADQKNTSTCIVGSIVV